MKKGSIYKNYPHKHLSFDKDCKNIPEILRKKSNSLYPSSQLWSQLNKHKSFSSLYILLFHQDQKANRKQFI